MKIILITKFASYENSKFNSFKLAFAFFLKILKEAKFITNHGLEPTFIDSKESNIQCTKIKFSIKDKDSSVNMTKSVGNFNFC